MWTEKQIPRKFKTNYHSSCASYTVAMICIYLLAVDTRPDS